MWFTPLGWVIVVLYFLAIFFLSMTAGLITSPDRSKWDRPVFFACLAYLIGALILALVLNGSGVLGS